MLLNRLNTLGLIHPQTIRYDGANIGEVRERLRQTARAGQEEE
jgi:hypothetical protein